MLLDSIETSTTTSKLGEESSATVLVYFISGNPGLIEYYRDFFEHLADSLQSTDGNTRYVLAGENLAGFEVNNQNHQWANSPPFALRAQISYVHRRLNTTATDLRKKIDQQAVSRSHSRLPVILIGHSVGAYILLEIIAKRQRAQKNSNTGDLDGAYEIIAGINLFPTVVDIAKSPSGKIATPFTRIPGFAWMISLLAKLLCFVLPEKLLGYLVRKVTGMPEGAAKTTTAFLQSRHGVYQALYMAKRELQEITNDKWDSNLWTPSPQSDIASKNGKPDKPTLFFYWGENDHWVDNRTRDELIATHARRLDTSADDLAKPFMEIDSRGIPHAFCIRNSKAVAEKVAGYIEEVTNSM